MPGEWNSPTQPFPTKPAPFDRQGVSEQDLIDFTPELNAEARAMLKEYKIGPLFTPPIVAGAGGLRGDTADSRGARRGALAGRGVDPETKMLYVPSVTNMTAVALQAGGDRSDMNFMAAVAVAAAAVRHAGGARGAPTGTDPEEAGRSAAAAAVAVVEAAVEADAAAQRPLGPGASRGPWGMGPQGLPLVKPPYGRITAYNMNTGDIVWQVANGDTYEWIKTHPALKGVNIPRTGRADEGGIVVTKTLAFAGQGLRVVQRRRRRRPDVLRVRQDDRRRRARAAAAGQHVRQSDDVHGGRQAVHRRRGRRAELPCRARRAVAAVVFAPGARFASLGRHIGVVARRRREPGVIHRECCDIGSCDIGSAGLQPCRTETTLRGSASHLAHHRRRLILLTEGSWILLSVTERA